MKTIPTRRSCARRLQRMWHLLACLLVTGALLAAYAQENVAAAHVFSQGEVESTFPPSVYFQGKSAPLQLRNAAAVRFGPEAVFFAGLVDNSGYASSVQERYQMYLLLEHAVHFGSAVLAAGAYGGGFVGDRFVVMDLGGHTVAEGATQMDAALARPRPLQLVQGTAPGEVRLYLGRRWVRISAAAAQPPAAR